jgi:hypothetical protein
MYSLSYDFLADRMREAESRSAAHRVAAHLSAAQRWSRRAERATRLARQHTARLDVARP